MHGEGVFGLSVRTGMDDFRLNGREGAYGQCDSSGDSTQSEANLPVGEQNDTDVQVRLTHDVVPAEGPACPED